MAADIYGLTSVETGGAFVAPVLPYQPITIRRPETGIALIGCGGISEVHLRAYRNAGYNVVALYSRSRERAEARRNAFFPSAAVYIDLSDILARTDVEVVDITTHVQFRGPLIEAALLAGKHVLSQKPFVRDPAEGLRLVLLAERMGLRLAVNQNGRWAPHFSYMREAIKAGLIGGVGSVVCAVQWNHHWIVGTAFEQLDTLILSDFAVHWFDIVRSFFGAAPCTRVYAAATRSPAQHARPPFLAHAAMEFLSGQATLAFDAACAHGHRDVSSVVGSRGSLRSTGPNLSEQRVVLYTEAGHASPELEGTWFPDGFQGAMAELLSAIEDDREPIHSGRDNLRTLAINAAVLESMASGLPVTVASVPER